MGKANLLLNLAVIDVVLALQHVAWKAERK